MSLRCPRWLREGGGHHPERRSATSWPWSWQWGSCRSAAEPEQMRLRTTASWVGLPWVPAGGTWGKRGWVSEWPGSETEVVWERRAGWLGAVGGGAAEGACLWMDARLPGRGRSHLKDRETRSHVKHLKTPSNPTPATVLRVRVLSPPPHCPSGLTSCVSSLPASVSRLWTD